MTLRRPVRMRLVCGIVSHWTYSAENAVFRSLDHILITNASSDAPDIEFFIYIHSLVPLMSHHDSSFTNRAGLDKEGVRRAPW